MGSAFVVISVNAVETWTFPADETPHSRNKTQHGRHVSPPFTRITQSTRPHHVLEASSAINGGLAVTHLQLGGTQRENQPGRPSSVMERHRGCLGRGNKVAGVRAEGNETSPSWRGQGRTDSACGCPRGLPLDAQMEMAKRHPSFITMVNRDGQDDTWSPNWSEEKTCYYAEWALEDAGQRYMMPLEHTLFFFVFSLLPQR
ncbi:uncharacterized protein UV8b_00566 [Ustilaginoidea virens]|uniref:Uncharacterized protein n=1 Tax=Ustilaginoidea virens TaxID=1159556 RepID=A0A8E5HJ05_USTVR|nr:uncharacterized protein UV8b_00566 [Ustilaginoidea virens]QUC16325.1 hypothetical protein UV8b_00566 [Ustilaginoidea virens]